MQRYHHRKEPLLCFSYIMSATLCLAVQDEMLWEEWTIFHLAFDCQRQFDNKRLCHHPTNCRQCPCVHLILIDKGVCEMDHGIKFKLNVEKHVQCIKCRVDVLQQCCVIRLSYTLHNKMAQNVCNLRIEWDRAMGADILRGLRGPFARVVLFF